MKNIVILGSTGSIGESVLKIVRKDKDINIQLLSANNNIKKLLKQAMEFEVKDAIIENQHQYRKYLKVFKKNKINLHLNIKKNINKILKKKIHYSINAISGIEGLDPTLSIIPFSKNILIANKESIMCGWHLIKKKLKLYRTNFIPIDSEHFSINELIKYEKLDNIQKIFLTASGGPFLNKKQKNIINVRPEIASKHPNWKMGKKISVDSSTLMNKIYEFIEAKKIFNLNNKKLSIIIHPSSFIHAIILLKGNLVKFLAHEPKMIIPISNAVKSYDNFKNYSEFNLINDLNKIKILKPDNKKFPFLKIIKMIPENDSFFETILITLNDNLVNKYLSGHINYISIQRNLLNLIKKPYFKKFYKLKPKNIYDIKKMTIHTKNFLEMNLKYYDK